MADEIFKNDGKISAKRPPTGFLGRWLWIVRFKKFNMEDPRWLMKFSKMTILKSVQYVHLRVFEVADYEFIVIFTKFNMADSRWWVTFWENTVESDWIAPRAVIQYYSKDKYSGSKAAVHITEISLWCLLAVNDYIAVAQLREAVDNYKSPFLFFLYFFFRFFCYYFLNILNNDISDNRHRIFAFLKNILKSK